ncbi:MAG: P-II family nitrogen regulator [Myxococcota bacterium]
MKLVIAYIRPERLNEVKQSLAKAEIYNMSVTNSLGSGRQGGYSETYRGAVMEMNLHQKARLELAVNDEYLEKTLAAITDGARTGETGDGVVFVVELVQAVRIRSGETGNDAIG